MDTKNKEEKFVLDLSAGFTHSIFYLKQSNTIKLKNSGARMLDDDEN